MRVVKLKIKKDIAGVMKAPQSCELQFVVGEKRD
jgi:hypothetical protein